MAAAGVDGWRKGWVIAFSDRGELRFDTVATAGDLDERLGYCRAVAIDMPMSLPHEGRRAAERDLKIFLGSAARSVFYTPTRDALAAETQSAATEINRANGGQGVSAQAWGLGKRIRELRAVLLHGHRPTWWETHPETSFAVMNDGDSLASKQSARGVAERLGLLRRHFPAVEQSLLDAPPAIPIADALDAAAAAWSAGRIMAGESRLFGPAGRDDEGFPLGVRV